MRAAGPLLLAALLALLPGRARAEPNAQDSTTIERGRYLTVMGDCEACHTAPGGTPFAGGRPIETPFGTIPSSNITPDRDTGIGAWSDHDFVNALQKGRGRDGAHIYPAMPYTYTARVTRGDALTIRAYLATLPPARNVVGPTSIPFPLNIRAFIGVWNRLFFREGVFRPDPSKSEEWNRGAYLVTGLAHCGMCHTPKNMLGGDQASRALQGYALQGWFAPNISNDGWRGLGGWSAGDIVDYLRAGHNRFAGASGPMAEEVAKSSSRISGADLRAIAVYLKDQPGQNDARPAAADPNGPVMRAGKAIYADRCSACHGPDGGGVAGLVPRLGGSAAVQSSDPTSVLRVILRGANSVATAAAPTGPAMPSFAWVLNDAQVAAAATFVRNAWGNAAPAVSDSTAAGERKKLERRAEE